MVDNVQEAREEPVVSKVDIFDSLLTISFLTKALKIEMVAERVRGIVRENASTLQSQDDNIKKYESLSKRYEEEYRKLENLQKDKELRI